MAYEREHIKNHSEAVLHKRIVGSGITNEAAAFGADIPCATVAGHTSGRSLPNLAHLIDYKRFFGAWILTELLAPAGVVVLEVAAKPVSAHHHLTQMIRGATGLSTTLEDGRIDRIERAQLITDLSKINNQAFVASLRQGLVQEMNGAVH